MRAARVTADDLARMRAGLFFDGPEARRTRSRFWILLSLAACIASAGVVSDSTATVIGAMIVAPLMTPILGAVLAISTSDRANLLRSLLFVASGALVAITIGYLFGSLMPLDVVADTSSQVAGRIHPRVMDLVAAIATGAVAAFAQCRSDVSDTLPGVAIAISLVPPLVVAGLTLEAGATQQSVGALLLFLTNVAAILLTGTLVMAFHGVPGFATGSGFHRRGATAVIAVLIAAVALPLVASSVRIVGDGMRVAVVTSASRRWAEAVDWEISSVTVDRDGVSVVARGPEPAPDPALLRALVDAEGLESTDVIVHLVPEDRVVLEGR